MDAEGADGRQAVQLAALLRLLPIEMEPAKRFRVIAHPDQGRERDQPGGGQLPRHPRAAAAKDLGGLLAGRMRLLPAAGAIGRNARRQRDHPQRVGMPNALWPAYRRLARTGACAAGWARPPRRYGTPAWRAPGRPGMARPPAAPAAGCGSERPPREAERPCSARRRRPSRCRCAKAPPGKPRRGRARESRCPRRRRRRRSRERMRARRALTGRARQRHAHRVEHAPQDGDPLVDMAADQELHRGAALELERARQRPPPAARPGILAPPRHRARAGQGIAELRPEPAAVLRIARLGPAAARAPGGTAWRRGRRPGSRPPGRPPGRNRRPRARAGSPPGNGRRASRDRSRPRRAAPARGVRGSRPGPPA